MTHAAVVRLEGAYVPWIHATGDPDGVTATVRGTAWMNGRLLTGDVLASTVTDVACTASPGERAAAVMDLCRKLNGRWALVVCWPDGEGFAAVDRLRTIPLFYGRLDDGRLVVGDSAAGLGDCAGAREIDLEAAVEMLLSGYVMGSRTIRRAVSQVQPGEVLHWRGGEVTVDRHFRFLRTEVSAEDPDSLMDALDETMDAAFARLARQFAGQRIIVPLSGGLDSRLVAAMLRRHGHRDLVALTYGRAGSAEVDTSRAVADALDIPWVFVPYADGEWGPVMATAQMREFWEYAGQGATLPHLQDFLALRHLRGLDPGQEAVVFSGVIGDMIAGVWTPSPILFREYSSRQPRKVRATEGRVDVPAVCDWLLTTKYDLWPARKDEVGTIERRMRSFFAGVMFTDMHNSATAFDLFEFENRQARYLANSVRAYESHGFDWWLPLCDDAVMDFFLTVPTELRRLKSLYATWMRRRVFAGQIAALAEIPPVGDGRHAWYGEPQRSRRQVLLERIRAFGQSNRTAEPRVVRDIRLGWAAREFRPTDLRFEEWFAADGATARTRRLRALTDRDDGPLAGLPTELSDRFHSRRDYPLCFVAPLALLSAAYLADVFRSARPGH